MPAGQPTKYKPEYCKLAEETLGKGFSIAGVAANCGVSRDTIYEWAKQHKPFSDSIKKGFELGQQWFENILHMKLKGESTEGFDARQSDTTLLIFAMKTRFYKDYGNKDKLDVNTTAEIKINIDEDDEGL